MAKKLYEETHVQSLANRIREKNGTTNKMPLREMPLAVNNLETSHYGKVPPYWKNAVKNAVSTINGLKQSDPNNIPLLAWFSDCHNSIKYSPNSGYTGVLASAVMNPCEIPFALASGDMGASSGNGFTSEDQMEECLMITNQILSPIGWYRLLMTQGNHDGSWGTANGKAYAYQMSPTQLYDYMYKKYELASNHVFGGGDNSYYYVDHEDAKIRVIVLNSLWCETSENADGTAVYDRQHYYGFGQAQLSWLANTALYFKEEGWTVFIGTHVPPISSQASNYRDMAILHGILTAYCDKTSYTGSYTYNSGKKEGAWANVSISVNFAGEITGKIAGFLCGHVHKDTIDTTTYKYPIITITSDANLSYDDAEEDRVKGTDNEHAIDFITVNPVKEEVVLTRLGVGSSRAYSYAGIALYSIANNLTNVTTNNGTASVESGSSYTATLTVKDNHTLESVAVTMGGVDITSSAYSNGTISIAKVTGNVVITAKATEIAKPKVYVDKMVVQSSNLNKRISGVNIAGTAEDGQGCFICDRIQVDITKECPVIFKGFASCMGAQGTTGYNYNNSKVALLDSAGTCLAVWYISRKGASNMWVCPISGNDCVGDLSTILAYSPIAGTKPNASAVKYVVFAPEISKSVITMDSLNKLEIQMIDE